MSMIRSRIGTDPEVLRHHPLAQRVAGAECRDQFSRPFSSRENYFLLTFPLIDVSTSPDALGDFYRSLLAKGMKPAMARLTLARKMAAIVLTIWKKGERFDPGELKRQAA